MPKKVTVTRNAGALIKSVLHEVPQAFQPQSMVVNAIALSEQNPKDVEKVLKVLTAMGHVEIDQTGNVRIAPSGVDLLNVFK